MATNDKKISMNISITAELNDPERTPPPKKKCHFGDELHASVLMTHDVPVEPNLAFGLCWVRTGPRAGRSKGRWSCYQSVAPGPKTDRTETSVQHRDRHSPKTNFPQTHGILPVSSAAKGHRTSPDWFFLPQFIFLPFLRDFLSLPATSSLSLLSDASSQLLCTCWRFLYCVYSFGISCWNSCLMLQNAE